MVRVGSFPVPLVPVWSGPVRSGPRPVGSALLGPVAGGGPASLPRPCEAPADFPMIHRSGHLDDRPSGTLSSSPNSKPRSTHPLARCPSSLLFARGGVLCGGPSIFVGCDVSGCIRMYRDVSGCILDDRLDAPRAAPKPTEFSPITMYHGQDVSRCIGMCQDASRCTKMYQDVSGCIRMCQDASRCIKMYQGASRCIRYL